MKHASIIICHYSKADDFGELKARRCRYSRSEMMKMTLTSLKESIDYPAEIIVVDNGGSPDDTDYLAQMVRDGLINTLIRNKNNMYFAYAWNQGYRLATGHYLVFTCNDIRFKKGWLSSCIKVLDENPDKKIIASPLVTPDKDWPKFFKEPLGEYRINVMAGSNCVVTTHKVMEDLGEWPQHPVGGTIWYRKMHKMGYLVAIPPVNMADHLARRGGVNFYKDIKTKATLLTGEEIDFNYRWDDDKNGNNKYFKGRQRSAGINL